MKTFIALSLLLFTEPLIAQQTVGLFTQNTGSMDGYILFAPTRADSTYLIDKCGKRIHQWSSNYMPGLSVYLLPNGNLLRSGFYQPNYFSAPGGLIETYDWNNNLLWSYVICDSTETQNHDIYPMPNGNILVVIWEKYTVQQAIASGRKPQFLGSELWSAKIQEIQPVGNSAANIVWEWRMWDHLVQDFDNTKDNYGVISDHPELLNINFTGPNPTALDWLHMNAVSYNEALDQIVISSHTLSEIYILDHSTTTAEAATHSGGARGKGGDFLYRWGNPAAYNRGTAGDQRLFLQHSPDWIPAGYKDANKIIIFNNGVNRPIGNASSVDIITPPVDSLGNYIINTGQAFEPVNAEWSYMDSVPNDFFSGIMGGAQRLPNGNTLICESTKGNFFEIDTMNNTVWRYVNPVNNAGIISQGTVATGNNSYRSVFYPVDYVGLAGKNLTPGDPIELNPLTYTCTMNTTTGLNDQGNATGSSISLRNPAVKTITLTSEKDIKNLEVILYSVSGKTLCRWNSININENGVVNLPLDENLTSGIYFLGLSNAEVNRTLKLIRLND